MLIQIAGLTKIYGKTIFALNEINMDIGNGMFGLLGPNGAGKTTLMQILVTLMKPSDSPLANALPFDWNGNRPTIT